MKTRKMMVTENVWSDFTHSGICAVYKYRTGKWTGKRLFLLYRRYVHYQRLQEMTIFDCYTLFIWLSGICIAFFFLLCIKGWLVVDRSKQWNYIQDCRTALPTIMTASILITAAIEATKGEDVAVIDLPGSFLNAKIDKVVHMVVWGKLAELMDKVAPHI